MNVPATILGYERGEYVPQNHAVSASCRVPQMIVWNIHGFSHVLPERAHGTTFQVSHGPPFVSVRPPYRFETEQTKRV
ncbi:hypothetical protein M8818_002352 [Zalaria obscura]|uniref:Uncharacterized protein n=1 Tax=Zalaria obscura TaxID=2024903 RepID=A0ACC3SHK2_9PEZI